MSEALAWALSRAREHTRALVADLPADAMHLQAAPGERHPAWLLGHLLLADTYLLHLLDVQPLDDRFPQLLARYGPASTPSGDGLYDAKPVLMERLEHSHAARMARVSAMTGQQLARPMPDVVLAQAQPTIGHHLHALVLHEGYHGGQLSVWRRVHGFAAAPWTPGRPPAGAGAP